MAGITQQQAQVIQENLNQLNQNPANKSENATKSKILKAQQKVKNAKEKLKKLQEKIAKDPAVDRDKAEMNKTELRLASKDLDIANVELVRTTKEVANDKEISVYNNKINRLRKDKDVSKRLLDEIKETKSNNNLNKITDTRVSKLTPAFK